MPDESVDLIYLDPPFNSNRAYNVIYPDDMGQVQAFADIWAWGPHCDAALEETGPGMDMLRALVDGMGKIQMAAYLIMMTPRLVELHRILKPTGSLYLHCDPTMSHYLKVILDGIFGRRNFRSEIVWRRINPTGRGSNRLANNADYILYYAKTDAFLWRQPYRPHDPSYVANFYRYRDDDGRPYRLGDLKGAGITRTGSSGKPWRGIDPTNTGSHWAIPGAALPKSAKSLSAQQKLDMLEGMGRIYWPPKGKVPAYKRYLDEMPGTPVDTIWDDIKNIQAHAKERLGYPTQKPLALLERIIRASSNPGDVVCDPFCGCGTSVAAAENLSRQWIGIDITYAAIAAIRERFRRERVDVWKDVEIVNKPETMQDVDRLLQPVSPIHPRKEFEKFCVASIGGLPNEKMGADGGVDGRIPLVLKKRANVSVKSGNVGVRDMRDLTGTLDDSKDVSGVFVTRQQPTRPMREWANQAGVVSLELIPPFPRMQILTLEEVLNGKRPVLPYAEAA